MLGATRVVDMFITMRLHFAACCVCLILRPGRRRLYRDSSARVRELQVVMPTIWRNTKDSISGPQDVLRE